MWRDRARAIVAGVILVLVLGALPVLWLARGGSQSDEQAVRAWFQSAAGGRASAVVASAIHVGGCQFTEYSTPAGAVQTCEITTEAPTTPSIRTCFVFSGDTVVSGGWQLAKVAPCNALRFDHASGELVDMPAHARYPVTVSE
jgi:hypothetical protein